MDSEKKQSDSTEKRGRPTKYSDELADKICYIISHSNRGIHSIANEVGLNADTIFDWINTNQIFSDKYARAKELQADFLVAEILEIADDSSGDEQHTEYGVKLNREFAERSKLRVETRKWIASKLFPKKWGDKKQEEETPKEITIRVIED